MEIEVTREAAKWYKDELDLSASAHIRLFPRYGGVGGLIPGFSLGINLDLPEQIHASTDVEGITFFIEHKDAWYFQDKDHLKIDLNDELNEPEFIYT